MKHEPSEPFVPAISDEEFNRLLNGPLAHPMFLMRFNRLSIALRVVLNATGSKGAKALRDHCAERDRRDNSPDEE